MVQFYFLSVLLNILVGIILINSSSTSMSTLNEDDDDEIKFSKDSIFSNETFCLVCAIICALVSFIKVFFTYNKSGNVPIFGDLFPAVTGLVCGGIILVEFYSKSIAQNNVPDWFETIFVNNKKYFGCFAIIVAIVHFAIPGVMFF